MVHRYIFVRLAPEHRDGMPLLKVLKSANEVLKAAFGVQGVYVGHAADHDTRQDWDLCFRLEYTSTVDMERSMSDPVVRSFVGNFLSPRAEAVQMASFTSEVPPRRPAINKNPLAGPFRS